MPKKNKMAKEESEEVEQANKKPHSSHGDFLLPGIYNDRGMTYSTVIIPRVEQPRSTQPGS